MIRISLDLDTTSAGIQSALERGVKDGFDVQVWLQADPGQSYDAVEFHIDFDPAILTVAGLVNNSGAKLPNQILAPDFDNAAGEIDFAQGAFGALPSGDLLLATITFQVVGAGTSDLLISDVFPRETVVTFGGSNILDGFDGGTLSAVTNRGFIEGGTGDDVLTGTGAADRMYGRGGDDTLRGRAGDDELVGNSGADRLFGHRGSDEIRGGGGADVAKGGKGSDLLKGNGGDDRLIGQGGADTLLGAKGADTLLGGKGADVLKGGAGADLLKGGGDDDRLLGGTGRDRLDGGAGDDVLIGGAQADTFVFGARFGKDRINDFTIGEDLIDLGETLTFSDLTIEQSGRNTRIEIDTNTIILRGIDANDVTEEIFDF